MKKIKKLRLANGLKVLLIPQKNTESATVLVLVKVGSEYENKKINGISHFCEHMCFKGTERRPDKLSIAKEFDALGAEYNAFTSKEYTGYFAKSTGANVGKIFNIISDIYLNSALPEEEIEKEKGVIIEEINMYRDEPRQHVWDMFLELLYKDQPAGRNTAGNPEAIKKLIKKDFLEFRKRFYHPANTIIAVAGNFNEKKIKKEIEKFFGKLKKQPVILKTKTVLKKQNRPSIQALFKKSDQTHFILGFECLNIFDERKYVLEILTTILGGGMSSRLFQKIREKMGLAYYVYAETMLLSDHGIFAAAAGVKNEKINAALSAVWQECLNIANKPVSEEELKIAKKRIRGQLALNIETSDELASFFSGQEIMLKKTLSPEEIFKKFNKVSASDIQKLAKQIFLKEKINIAAIGPEKILMKI